jgi:hypothetical protein
MDYGLALWAPRNDEGINKPNRIYQGTHSCSEATAYTAAMQSISISNGPNHRGTQTKMRAGGLFGKYRS